MNPVLESARWISENSKHVIIGSKIDDAAREVISITHLLN
jgi:hypothetical protein